MVAPRTAVPAEAPAVWPVLTQRHVAALTMAFAAVVAGILWWSVRTDYRAVLALWQSQLSASAEYRRGWMNEWLTERGGDARMVAGFPTVRAALQQRLAGDRLEPLPPAEERHLRDAIATALDERVAGAITVIDPQGRVAFTVGSVTVPTTILTDLGVNPPAVTDVTIDGRLLLMFSAAVREENAPNGRIMGWVLTLVDPAVRLWPLLMAEGLPVSTGEALIVRRHGDSISYLSPLRFAEPGKVLRLPADTPGLAARDATAGRNVFGEFSDYRGERVLAATRGLDVPGWGLIRKIDRTEAFATYKKAIRRSTVIALLAVVAFGAGMLSLGRRQRARALDAELHRERQLRASEARFRALFDHAAVAICIVDLEGKFVEVNDALCKLTGVPRDLLLGRSFMELSHPDYAERARQRFEWLVRGEADSYAVERPFVAPDSRVVWARVSAALIRDGTGQPRYVAVVLDDITGQKEAAEAIQRINAELEERVAQRTAALEEANAELSAFNYSVSHDLRAPLRHIEGFIRILEEDYAAALPLEGRHYLDRVRAGSVRINQLIDALLRLVRIGRAEMQPRSVNLTELARATFEDLRQHDNDHAIDFVVGQLPRVSGDPVLLRELFDNLLGNAIKFTRPVVPARIEVGAEQHNGDRVLYVRDNGVGFDPDHGDRLFRVFQRLHNAQDFEGTGIGLSIVKRIVEKHGGRVWAESVPGNGATFYFTLPEPAEPRD
ncbi:PAS domain S-box protein [Candidatus Binatia bacterium]|nr:PAS domain S-box protein [Candidatus Binatia bacterium]